MTFSQRGSVITIFTRTRCDAAEVEVRNRGCGVPRKDMSRVFGKFVRAENAHLSRPDGNGLGLFIARGIVKHAGSELWMQREESQGTSVFFALPLSAG